MRAAIGGVEVVAPLRNFATERYLRMAMALGGAINDGLPYGHRLRHGCIQVNLLYSCAFVHLNWSFLDANKSRSDRLAFRIGNC